MSRNATIMVMLLFKNGAWFLDKLMLHQEAQSLLFEKLEVLKSQVLSKSFQIS